MPRRDTAERHPSCEALRSRRTTTRRTPLWRSTVETTMTRTAIPFVLVATLAATVSSGIVFVEHTIDAGIHGTGGIHAGDLDCDGDVDVLAAGLEDNQIVFWSNSGTEPIQWARHTIGGNVVSAHSVYAVDIDLNDTLDVVGAAYYGTPGVAWWRNNGGDPIGWTKYSVALQFTNAHEIYAHDLDGDGDSDILGASSDLNRISWWRNDRGAPIEWSEHTISDDVTLAKSVHVGDFDGDGHSDVVGAAITAHDVIWWRNDGGDPIQWTEFLIDGSFLGAHRVQALDLDKDGDDDVLCAGYLGHQVAWYRNEGGDPVAWTKCIIGTGLTNACVAFAADLDSDGDNDVVVTAQAINQISWFENDGGDGTAWTKHVITDDFVRPWPLYLCDVDGDGDIDVIAGSSHQGNNRLSWWENQGPSAGEALPGRAVWIDICQNFPNPLSDHTTIEFSGSERNGSLAHARVAVFDEMGRQVAALIPWQSPSGTYRMTWSGRDESGRDLPAGAYIYELRLGSQRVTRTMVKVR